MNAESEMQNAEVVREFFNQWALYRKVVDANYLFHREAMASLSAWLDGRVVRSFLDLGCGDASFTTEVLAGRGVERYRAVDLSPVALDLARENARRLGGGRELICGDFFEEVPRMVSMSDVVYIGLSLHHLPNDQKAEFFRSVVGCVAGGGAFVFFEPTLRVGETCDAYMRRFMHLVREDWTSLTPDEMDGVAEHVTKCDFPETLETYRAMASEAGFDGGEVIFTDSSELYTMVVFGRSSTSGARVSSVAPSAR